MSRGDPRHRHEIWNIQKDHEGLGNHEEEKKFILNLMQNCVGYNDGYFLYKITHKEEQESLTPILQ